VDSSRLSAAVARRAMVPLRRRMEVARPEDRELARRRLAAPVPARRARSASGRRQSLREVQRPVLGTDPRSRSGTSLSLTGGLLEKVGLQQQSASRRVPQGRSPSTRQWASSFSRCPRAAATSGARARVSAFPQPARARPRERRGSSSSRFRSSAAAAPAARWSFADAVADSRMTALAVTSRSA
jgi:hypothetical protein